jgi:hypothetical protein
MIGSQIPLNIIDLARKSVREAIEKNNMEDLSKLLNAGLPLDEFCSNTG